MRNTFLYSVLFDLHYDVSITGLRTIPYAKCLAKLICLHGRHDLYGCWFYLLSFVSSPFHSIIVRYTTTYRRTPLERCYYIVCNQGSVRGGNFWVVFGYFGIIVSRPTLGLFCQL